MLFELSEDINDATLIYSLILLKNLNMKIKEDDLKTHLTFTTVQKKNSISIPKIKPDQQYLFVYKIQDYTEITEVGFPQCI